MATKKPPVDEFLTSVPDEGRRADAQHLIKVMQEITGEPPYMSHKGIVGFGSYHYRYASGHEGDDALVSFAPRSQHLVLYLSGGFEDEHQALMSKLGPHKTGKGCLYIKRLADVDESVLRQLIEHSIRQKTG